MSKPIRELNLELGRPDAAEALRRLAAEVEAARHLGIPAMKLIHGYGSSGRGGRLRTACRTWLRQQELCFLPGEEFTIFNEEARRWLAVCPPPAAGPGPGRGKSGRYLCAAEKIEYPPAYPAADAFASAGFSCPEPPDVLH